VGAARARARRDTIPLQIRATEVTNPTRYRRRSDRRGAPLPNRQRLGPRPARLGTVAHHAQRTPCAARTSCGTDLTLLGRPVLGEGRELEFVCCGARVLVGQEENGIGDPVRVGKCFRRDSGAC
jgi:hypothetical protein